jgi:hypothetical protein
MRAADGGSCDLYKSDKDGNILVPAPRSRDARARLRARRRRLSGPPVTDLTTLAAVKLYSGITTTTDDAMLGADHGLQPVGQVVHQPRLHADNYEIWRDGRDSGSCCCRNIRSLDVTLVEVDGKSIAAQTAASAARLPLHRHPAGPRRLASASAGAARTST